MSDRRDMHGIYNLHETRDASVLGVSLTLLGIAIFGFGLALGGKFELKAFKNRFHPAPSLPTAFLPPLPRLQVDEAGDLRRYLLEQKRLLESYGHTAQGQRHIPIERAMERLSHD